MNFTTAVTADVIAYLVVMTFYVELTAIIYLFIYINNCPTTDKFLDL